jgi:hypothetical protein
MPPKHRKTPRKRRPRHSPLSVLEGNSLQTEFNSFCITDCILQPRTPAPSRPLTPNFPPLSSQAEHAARVIQQHWRAFKMRHLLAQYVVETES